MMGQIRKKSFWLILFFVGIYVFSGLFSFNSTHAAELNFQVDIVQPENQIDKTQTYFDLMVKPGMTQDLKIKVSNLADKEITVAIKPNSGTTNQNGEVSYSETPKIKDDTLKNPITSLLSGEQRIVLAPKEIKEVLFTLSIPDKAFSGKIVGGFLFQEEIKKETKNPTKGVTLTNQFVLVKGIQLRESMDPIKENLVIHDVELTTIDHRGAVVVKVQNTQPDFVKNGSIKIKIQKKGYSNVFFEETKNELNMAPNSTVGLPYYIKDLLEEAGNYSVEVEVKTKGFQKKETKTLTVTKKQLSHIYEETKDMEFKRPIDIKIVIVVILLVCTFTVFSTFFHFKKRKKKNNKK